VKEEGQQAVQPEAGGRGWIRAEAEGRGQRRSCSLSLPSRPS